MNQSFKWITNARALATVLVVLLHVSAPLVTSYPKVSINTWWIGNFYDGISRCCVPIFFMITGAILLDKDYKLKTFFTKRFLKIIPPFLFWTCVYAIFDQLIFSENSFVFELFLTKLIQGLLYGIKYHLWFIYAILTVYLVIPILRTWVKHSSLNEILYFLILWGASMIFSSKIVINYLPNINLQFFTGYLGFAVLGYYLNRIEIKNLKTPIILFVSGTLITLIGCYILTVKGRKFDHTFYDYNTLNVVITSIGAFLLIKSLKIKQPLIQYIFSFISKNSFGIYLIHILILELLEIIGVNYYFTYPLLAIPLTTIACLSISSLIIHKMKQYKYLSWVSG